MRLACHFHPWSAVLAVLLSFSTTMSLSAQEEGKQGWKKWQRDLVLFHADLRKLVQEARVPAEEEFRKRLKQKERDLEVITDGGGGVVDFKAAEGTIQQVASKVYSNHEVEWEIELHGDTKIAWNKSTVLVPRFKGMNDEQEPFFAIKIRKAKAGPFKEGQRVRLKASIDDFSRFREGYSDATGLVVVYYLENAPNPIMILKLDEAEVMLIESGERKK